MKGKTLYPALLELLGKGDSFSLVELLVVLSAAIEAVNIVRKLNVDDFANTDTLKDSSSLEDRSMKKSMEQMHDTTTGNKIGLAPIWFR